MTSPTFDHYATANEAATKADVERTEQFLSSRVERLEKHIQDLEGKHDRLSYNITTSVVGAAIIGSYLLLGLVMKFS